MIGVWQLRLDMQTKQHTFIPLSRHRFNLQNDALIKLLAYHSNINRDAPIYKIGNLTFGESTQ